MTTPHADRPWWPPAAPSGYIIHTTEPSLAQGHEPTAVIFDEAQELDEPVPYILTDEPVGERVHGFPLDEGDPGTPLLPVAPEGVLLLCPACPATLADTAGGVLWHHDDGSHTLEPPSDAGLDLRAERDLWKARATIAQGKVARVAALPAEWKRRAAVHLGAGANAYERAAREVGAALAGPEPEATGIREDEIARLRAKIDQAARAIQLEACGLREHTLMQMPNPNVALALENIARALVEP